MANVLIGKESVSFTGMRPIRYLAMAPIAPPRPTARIFMGESQTYQAQRDQQLSDIIQSDICDSKAYLRFGSERVQDQNDIAEQE